jgi:hypothetical protein
MKIGLFNTKFVVLNRDSKTHQNKAIKILNLRINDNKQ